jgi:flavin reductase (DIM6/NTAB) family NADH-FMN oxidoreductase RutF
MVPMKLVKNILEKLNGLHYPQEYLCFAMEHFSQPLKMYLVKEGEVKAEIGTSHAFVGYHPVLFVFPSLPDVQSQDRIEIVFADREMIRGERWQSKNAIAFFRMKKVKVQATPAGELHYYEGIAGKHRFVSGFRQWVLQLYNRLYKQKPGNVFLKGNLYKQVQIAYALPRKICLICVGLNGLYNLFPTDLHGQVNEQYYIISLRHEGKACGQVTTAGRIVLSEINARDCQKVYRLGKNHMQSPKEASAFDFSSSASTVFCLPLPAGCIAYKELRLEDSFIMGIHRLLLFRIISSQYREEAPGTLVHIHNSYATWRYNRGMAGNYFIR